METRRPDSAYHTVARNDFTEEGIKYLKEINAGKRHIVREVV